MDDKADDLIALLHGLDRGATASCVLAMFMGIRARDGFGWTKATGGLQANRLDVGSTGKKWFHRVSVLAGFALVVVISADAPVGLGVD